MTLMPQLLDSCVAYKRGNDFVKRLERRTLSFGPERLKIFQSFSARNGPRKTDWPDAVEARGRGRRVGWAYKQYGSVWMTGSRTKARWAQFWKQTGGKHVEKARHGSSIHVERNALFRSISGTFRRGCSIGGCSP